MTEPINTWKVNYRYFRDEIYARISKTLLFPKALKVSWSWSCKVAKTKKDTKARVPGRRKQTKESGAEQLYVDNIPMGLNEYEDSSVSANIAVKFPNFPEP